MAISEGGFSMPPRQNGDAVGINRSVLISSSADEAREYARRQREPAFRASPRWRRAYLETLSAVSSLPVPRPAAHPSGELIAAPLVNTKSERPKEST